MIGRVLKARDYLLALLALPAVLLARALRPFVLVRFGNLRNHTIGTFSLHAATYLTDKELGVNQPRSIDFFYHTEPRANRILDGLVERRLNVYRFAKFCYAINSRLPNARRHVCDLGSAEFDRRRDHHRAFLTKQHFELSDQQKRQALSTLQLHTGMPLDAPIVCFFARNSSYLKILHAGGTVRASGEVPNENIRDSSIETYLPAAVELAERGYWCFRMGAVVDAPIPNVHERVIDYASQFRSELLDMYLMSHCRFSLSDTTGLVDTCLMFRKHAARANVVNLLVLHSWGEVFIPKLFKIVSQNRVMTLPEVLNAGLGIFSSGDWTRLAAKHGLSPIDNSAEEILDLALEAEARLRGVWIDTAEDQVRQARVAESYRGHPLLLAGPRKAILASSFLRRRPEFAGPA